MAVIIGSARIDENGKISGGKAGNQTGEEIVREEWYLHRKGWILIRAKDAKKREKIAQDMEYICDNPNIGYDQSQNYTLYDAAKKYKFNASKVKEPCECDCARAVRGCVLYAGIECADFYTAIEPDVLNATGAFDILKDDKYVKSSDYLLRGDILVTRTKGHTVVVLSDGDKAKPAPNKSVEISKPAYANYTDVSFAGLYRPTTSLYMRTNAGAEYVPIKVNDQNVVIKTSEVVTNYGYYSVSKDGKRWLLVALVRDGKTITGFASASYLVKIRRV